MKNLHVEEPIRVMVPDFLLRACSEKKIKAFRLIIDGEDVEATILVQIDEVAKSFPDGSPETVTGKLNLKVKL